MAIKSVQNNKGYALYTAIILTGVLIIVAYATANLSIKELQLSSIAADSHIALYNADSGLECALYADLKSTLGVSAFDPSTGGTVNCNGQSITTGSESAVQTRPTQPSVVGGPSGGGAPVNYALSANGGTARASSQLGPNYPVSSTVDGDRTGTGWSTGTGGWNDATVSVYPDWLEVDLSGLQSINEIDVFTIQDNYTNPTTPTPSMTFAVYGITDFEVQYDNAGTWTDVPGGNIVNNRLVWTKLNFSAVNTSKIRVLVHNALNAYSRIVQVEAWGAGSSGTSSSSLFQLNFPVGCAIVSVVKNSNTTFIQSHGYNSCTGSKRVERGIQIQY